MSVSTTIELKAFVPARDFELSKQFYQDLGFTVTDIGADLAYCACGVSKFLLQRFCVKELAENLMLHLLVEDVDAWWGRVAGARIAEKYGVKALPPEQRSWGMRDFVLYDPTGVLWRIGQDSPAVIGR